MVTSVNGDRGSPVLPIKEDDYKFLTRGRHVWLDNTDVHYSGSSGETIINEIRSSGTRKIDQARTTMSNMKLMLLEGIGGDDYRLRCGGYPYPY